MRSRSKIFILFIIVLVIALSACGPEDMQEIEDQLDPEGDGLSGEAAAAPRVNDQQTNVYYHHETKHDHIKFNIELYMYVDFNEKTPGKWIAAAIGFQEVRLEMQPSVGESGPCKIVCNIPLNINGEGPVTPISDDECKIPMSFQFNPHEDWILESDCPDETLAVTDCAALSLLMFDPGVYTFTKAKPYDWKVKTVTLTREAMIKNVDMPDDLGELCDW